MLDPKDLPKINIDASGNPLPSTQTLPEAPPVPDNQPIVYPQDLNELEAGLKQGKNWGDPALDGIDPNKAIYDLKGGFNDGSTVLANLKAQLAKEQAAGAGKRLIYPSVPCSSEAGGIR